MKVLLINGSPHEHGCTWAALCEVAKPLQAAGIETEIFHIGRQPVGGCVACGGCAKAGRCVFDAPDGPVNRAIRLAAEADAVVFGAPVHYAEPAPSMLGLMHRLAVAGGAGLRHKPAAIVTSARRAGTTTTLDALAKVPQYFEMPLVNSTYWPMVHGSNAEQAAQDAEGMQIMRNLGGNLAWLLQCIEAGKKAGITPPPAESAVRTDFIR